MRNIICYMIDDVGREQVREYGFDAGNTYPTLPNISALIQNGVRFTRAYSQPWCSPTRVMWHTGLLAYQSGVAQLTENNQPMMERFTALPAALKIATNNAYRCGAFGKWHMGDWASDGGEHEQPVRVGYDYYAGHLRNLLQGESFYSWPCTTAWRTKTGIKTGQKLIQEWLGDWMVEHALEWVDQEPSQPFFMWFAPGICHDPLARPPPEQYNAARYGLTTKYAIPGNIILPNGLPYSNSYFKANIEASDYVLGKLLSGLPQATLANTVVIFWSDNGTASGSINPGVNVSHAKQTVYEDGVNVPLVVSGPGVARPGRLSNVLVQPADLYQTCLDITGGTTAVPQSGGTTRQSYSFESFLRLPQTLQSNRPYVIADIFGPSGPNLNGATQANRKIADTRGYAIVRNHGIGTGGWPASTGGTKSGGFQLYNVLVDPFETVDLLNSASSPFVSGSTINLVDNNPTYPNAKTAYEALVALYASAMAAY